ncbi:hypothetical protein ScalyP_jg382, partial [Parmales sp. scaly parma]
GGGGGGKKGKGHKKSKSSDNVGVGIGIGIGAGAGDIDSSHTAARPRSRGHVRATCDDEKLGVEQSVDAKDELVFVKHWRVGDINARVSLSGFPVDTNAYGIRIPAFNKSRKVGNWNYLITKLITHAQREVIKSTAASGLSK